MNPPEIHWIKRDDEDHACCWDDNVMLIAVRVKNTKTGEWNWDIDKVSVCADEDQMTLYYYEGEAYSAWEWEDVDYFSMLEGSMPCRWDDK